MTLLGRTAEQETVSRLLASARLGRGGALVLTGDPGIGKTALLSEVLARHTAGEEVRVLRATGTEVEQDLPFATLHALLLPALHLLDEIPGPQAVALGSALNVRSGDGAADRFAIGAATLSLLSRYAEGPPVVVVLDDAQWADRPSVDALAFAARRVHNDPVAVLAASRSGELPDALQDLPVLEVWGLQEDAAAQLVAHAVPGGRTEDGLRQLLLVTGGNPLALLELATDVDVVGGRDALTGASRDGAVLLPALPQRLRDAFARRVEQLSPQDREVALVAAIAGEDLRLTRAVCGELGLDPDRLARATAAGLLTGGPGGATFRHPLLRSVVYAAAPEELRRRVHRAAADQLRSPADADRRTWHLATATAGLDEGVATLLEELGARAGARAAFTVAGTALERAARLTPDAGSARSRLVASAAAAWAGGQPERALRLLDEAEPLGAVPTAAGAELRATIAVRSGSLREALDLLERAAALVRPDERVLLLADACRTCMYLVDMASLERVDARLSETLTDVGQPVARAVGLAASGAAGVLLGRDSAARLRAAVPLLLAHHVDPVAQPAVVPWLLLAPLFLRDADAGAELRDLVDGVRARVGVGALPNLLFHVARDQATASSWKRAGANYDEAARLARETGQGTELAMVLAGLACLDARAGRDGDCREHAAEALTLCHDRSLHFGEIWCELALGDLALSEGAADEAVDRLVALATRLEELGVGDPDLHPGPELVDALLRVGRADEARDATRAFVALARGTGRPWALARAERALGLVAPADGFDAHFAAALDHHARTRDVFEAARTRLAHGMRLRRTGRRVDARGVLREALGAFDDLGALTWAGSARAELEATGAKVPPREPVGPGALTPQELQVCLLLAEGRTTREAAAALFLSPKTIEYHLRKAYTKLGIHSREELARVLQVLD